MKKVVLIGDSIRLHYQPLVVRDLKGVAEVWGPEENCRSSITVRDNLEDWVISRNPDIVHINCGAHDIRRDEGSSVPMVPLTSYVANLEAIFEQIRLKTRATLIWATSTPMNEEWHNATRNSRRYEADATAYNLAALTVAGRIGVAINDLNAAVVQANPNLLLKSDGVHFKDEGYSFLAERVVEMIQPFLSG